MPEIWILAWLVPWYGKGLWGFQTPVESNSNEIAFTFNSLSPWETLFGFKCFIFKHILVTDLFGFTWLPQCLIQDGTALVYAVACVICQPTVHQCWRFMTHMVLPEPLGANELILMIMAQSNQHIWVEIHKLSAKWNLQPEYMSYVTYITGIYCNVNR